MIKGLLEDYLLINKELNVEGPLNNEIISLINLINETELSNDLVKELIGKAGTKEVLRAQLIITCNQLNVHKLMAYFARLKKEYQPSSEIALLIDDLIKLTSNLTKQQGELYKITGIELQRLEGKHFKY